MMAAIPPNPGRGPQTAVILGSNGQDAYYLRKLLESRGDRVIGVSRRGEGERLDLGDLEGVCAFIRDRAPQRVFHLAAVSSTRHDALLENHRTIATGSVHLLEAVRRHAPEARVFLAGSGLQFRNDGRPIKETDPFEATSAYALARIHSAYAARYYRSLGVRAYVGYLFHHDSPRRPPEHVSQRIASTVRRIAQGSDEILEIGDPTVLKEWTFAGDVARAMLHLIDQERVMEAAIGSGEAHTIQEWIEACFAVAGLDWRPRVRTVEGFRAEYPALLADPSTIRGLGWAPRVDFTALAKQMLEEPREGA